MTFATKHDARLVVRCEYVQRVDAVRFGDRDGVIALLGTTALLYDGLNKIFRFHDYAEFMIN